MLNFNYILGKIFGNWRNAYKLYLDLINNIQGFCDKNNIPLILVGPVSRPRNYIENYLSIKLNNLCEIAEHGSNTIYIRTLGIYNENNEKLFFDDGMYVNNKGHERIANYLYKIIVDKYLETSTCQ